MDPNEALLSSIESILGDDGLDDSARNTALAETVKQFADYTGAPQAKQAILKRDDVEGKTGFEISNEGARARLRMLVENQRRSRPALSEAQAVAAGWRTLVYADRNALLAEDDNGQDPTFDPENADVQSGQLDKRAARTAAIAKANYAFHAVNVLAKQLCEEDPRMTIEKARVEARRLNPEWARK
jgi:hypothetical protein